jgi:hypothetical protein
MKAPRYAVVSIGGILISVLFLLSSCGGAANPRLEGTWTLTTQNGSGDDVGNGTYTIKYITELPIGDTIITYFYSGEALITNISGDTTYKVSVEQKYGTTGFAYSLYLYQDPDPKSVESIRMQGDLSGSSSASGNYDVIGSKYSHFGTGSFHTRRLD